MNGEQKAEAYAASLLIPKNITDAAINHSGEIFRFTCLR